MLRMLLVYIRSYKVVQIRPGLFTLVNKCKQSRSYLNHLVYKINYEIKIFNFGYLSSGNSIVTPVKM